MVDHLHFKRERVEELLRELPFALAAALRLRGAGADRDQIAAALHIPPRQSTPSSISPPAS